VAVVPVFNPEPGTVAFVERLAENFGQVVVVDDGSAENAGEFDRLPASVTVLRHEINRGKGRAIKTAIAWIVANLPWMRVAVFADGDGQHRIEDVRAVAERALASGDVTFGVRDFFRAGIPFRSRLGNITTSLVIRLCYGIRTGDTQTGLRAIPMRLLPDVAELPGERFEFEIQMFPFLRDRREKLEQVPIKTIYLEANRASHFRPLTDTYRIFKGLLTR